jgi:histidinol dehydrogenase
MSDELDQILILPSQPDYNERLEKLREKKTPAGRFSGSDPETEDVRNILRDVSEEGNFENTDDAVRHYTKKYDKNVDLKPEEFKIPKKDLQKAHAEIDKHLLASIRQAIENVRQYQEEIFIGNDKKCSCGTGIRYTPIKRVGICVPGASAPLPSTVIMCAVPAQVAGVKEIVVVSPPRYKGSIHPTTLAVCYELGITEVYRVGGAQAVAALAFKKGTIPQVDKIVGPGNKWVQTAKKMVSGDYVAIDSIAGPSEVLIIANDKANPAWVAADMLSQTEHAQDSIAIAATDSETIAKEILKELKNQVGELSRIEDAEKSLLAFSAIVTLNDMSEVINLADDLASEHLEIQCGGDSREIADRIYNAGAIFIGDYSPVAVGDYWAGPSHTLPTGQTAKFFSALSANDFIKATSIIEYDKKKLAESAEDIIRLAEAEGLDAHARSIRIRQEK